MFPVGTTETLFVSFIFHEYICVWMPLLLTHPLQYVPALKQPTFLINGGRIKNLIVFRINRNKALSYFNKILRTCNNDKSHYLHLLNPAIVDSV